MGIGQSDLTEKEKRELEEDGYTYLNLGNITYEIEEITINKFEEFGYYRYG